MAAGAAADALMLTDARDLLLAAGVGRDEARGRKKVTGTTYVDAITKGQAERLDARALLEDIKDDLEAVGADDGVNVV